MKLPFVSRAAYDDRGLTIERLLTAFADQLERYERLVDKITDMQRQGFTVREPQRQPEPSSDLPSVVTDAILGRAGSLGNSLGVQLSREAQRRLSEDTDPEVVASAIWTGDHEDDGA